MSKEFNVEEILSELTTKEKIKLLSLKNSWHTTDIPRLSIPSLRLSDGPNGVRGTKLFRAFPSALLTSGTGLASTWNMGLLKEAGDLMATEAKHKGVHVILGPTCNIQRGPLGGRGFESFSEDPLLSGYCSANVINGIQEQGISATIKHYVCNDLEDDRIFLDVIVSQRALREVYLLPFQIAFRDSSPNCVMSAYNKVNGEHVSQSKFLLDDVLRKEYGWDGLIMSDWFGVYSLKESLDATLDLECPGQPTMRKHDSLAHAISAREISMDVIDERVRHVLELVKTALKTGIPENGKEDADNNTPETSALLRKVAQEAVVLLKNDRDILPLEKEETVAVIGPSAKIGGINGGGSASLNPYYDVSIFDGVASKIGKAPEFALGCSVDKLLYDMGKFATHDGGKKGCSFKVYKEPVGTPNRTLIEDFTLASTKFWLFDYINEKAENNLFYMDIEGEYTPEKSGNYNFKVSCLGTTLLYIDDELFIDDKTEQKLGPPAIGSGSLGETKSKFLEAGKSYKFRIEFGSGPTFTLEINTIIPVGGGALDVSIALSESEEQRLMDAVEVAKSVDKVVICTGTSTDWESEGYDRAGMGLLGAQDKLVEAVLAVNKDVIVVNQSGTPVTMPWSDKVPGIVQAWFNGCEAGNAVADVLYNDCNPSGKLSLTFPKKNEDNPAFLNFKSNNGTCVYGEDVFVGYKYYEKTKTEPLFAFGHGLSYTSFKFDKFSVKVEGDKVIASVEVTNTGKCNGSEVVQFYVAPPTTTTVVERPLKELKGFQKVALKAGASSVVTIEVPVKYTCSYYDGDRLKWCTEKGEYTGLVGNSSDGELLSDKFSIDKTSFWTGL